ncbi:MAG TPA: ABC transporter ATP-binding protein [Candidatus Cloacimonadota bacterium]|nr:ABC transporter ATP-binding protein [Candidatus Cloacimonadota bacterium]HOQ80117.1 ABC transporter ATP-binding protein [Candidatus Cloacimonadota bacterium]HPK40176.1 ABC transporter ATP-binding protein [Candidatus Cloacimonadota bacterium]
MEILRANSIVKNYQDANSVLKILRSVNLSVCKADLIAIRGSSGSGKSTLLHILGMLDSPTSGEIHYFDKLVTSKNKELAAFRNKHIGFVFQFHFLLMDFTAIENVAIPMYIAGKSWHKALKEAGELLARIGMHERLNHYPNQLSGGEQQRTAIARALINHPDIVFADEPTGNLDAKHAEEIISLIKGLNEDYGQTFIIATHDQMICNSMNTNYRLEQGVLELVPGMNS